MSGTNLDFSEFDGDVYISGMKVQGDLFQELQEVHQYTRKYYKCRSQGRIMIIPQRG